METGSLIGAYKVIGILGSGGMGTVYLAEHVLLGRRAAIKTLLPELSSQPEIAERFFNEARAASAIGDAGVVQVFDFGFAETSDRAGAPTAYIVMELLEGETLAARIERVGPLPVGEALRITRQCATSLAAAHAKDIVHRDLKPENVFLVPDIEAQGGERTKVLDFGIAKVHVEGSPVRTQTGVTMGTPVYMSPEQCRGAGEVDHRADIYALGCVLFQMVTGQPPFDGEGSGDLISAHLRDEPPVPSELWPCIPTHVDTLILRCLAKSPDGRYSSMDELRLAVEQSLARLSSPQHLRRSATMPAQVEVPLASGFRSQMPTTLGSSAGEVDTRPRRRARWIGGTAAAIAIALLAFTAFDRAETSDPTGSDPAPSAVVAPPPPPPPAAPAPIPAAPTAAVLPVASPPEPPPPPPRITKHKPKKKPSKPHSAPASSPHAAAAAEDLYDTR